jgi:hypothetical protein
MPHLLIPLWFYGFDSAMYFISALIGFLISYNSYKLYSITREKPHFYLHFGFMFLSLGLLLLGLVSSLSYITLRSCRIGCELSLFDTVFDVEDFGYLLYFILSIIGYTLLASTYTSEKSRKPSLILIFLLLFSTIIILVGEPRNEPLVWCSYHQYFHLLSFLILGYILFRVLINFSEAKDTNSFFVVLGFAGIIIFHILHIFSYFTPWTYVFAHISLIIGYLSLLAMLIRVKH